MSEIIGPDEGQGPAQLVEQLRLLSKRTSAAARAYWLPLILFGALICGSLPFYEKLGAQGASARFYRGGAVTATHLIKAEVTALGYYWQLALLAGVLLTAWWYRWRGRHSGLRTPARGFLVTGLAISELGCWSRCSSGSRARSAWPGSCTTRINPGRSSSSRPCSGRWPGPSTAGRSRSSPACFSSSRSSSASSRMAASRAAPPE